MQVTTAKRWWKRYGEEGNVDRRPNPGRVPKLSPEQRAEILNKFRDNPFLHASDVAREYNVSAKPILSLLSRNGIRCHIAASQPALTEEHKINRIAFCERMLEDFDVNYYQNILFSDEKTFATDLRHQKLVYRPINTRYEPKYVTEYRLSGRITDSFWGCIGYDGPVTELIRVNGNLESQQYMRILRNNLIPIMNEFNNNKMFMQDNSRIHTSNVVMGFLSRQQFDILDWPPNSPDLNPIENVWGEITREWPKMQNRNHEALNAILIEKWNALRNRLGNTHR